MKLAKLGFVVDADILIYQAATSAQQDVCWDGDLWTTHASLEEAKQKLVDMVDMWVDGAKEEYGEPEWGVTYVVSDPDTEANYRKQLPHVEYKGNRKGFKRPLVWAQLREWFVENYAPAWEPTLEGDDMCGLLRGENDVVISQDKDMLTLPGKHYRPGKGAVTVTEEEAMTFFYTQVLMGDRVDGYYGVPRVGEKTAASWLKRPGRPWDNIVLAYTKAGLTEEHALANARCAWILRGDDYDFNTKEVRLWTPRD